MKSKNRPSMARVSKIPRKPSSMAARALNEMNVNVIDSSGLEISDKDVQENHGDIHHVASLAVDADKDSLDTSSLKAPIGMDVCRDNDNTSHDPVDKGKDSLFCSFDDNLKWDSLGSLEWTEEGLCVRCNKGDQVLLCTSSECALAVHECCLGVPPCFDDTGKFYCPLCAYKQAIVDFEEVEKAVVTAKKKARLGRKSFSLFVNGRVPDDMHNTTHDAISKRTTVCEKSSRGADDQEVLVDREVNTSTVNKVNGVSQARKRVCVEQVDDQLGDNIIGNSGCSEDLVRLCDSAMYCKAQQNVNDKDMVEVLQSRGGDTQGRQTEANVDFETSNSSDEFKETAETFAYTVVKPKTVGLAPSSSLERINNREPAIINVLSKKSKKDNMSVKRCSNLLLPNSRHQKLPWTDDEEEMLKEAVLQFSSSPKKKMSWMSILDVGGHVFDKSRTPVDLKDKWRNMEKGRLQS